MNNVQDWQTINSEREVQSMKTINRYSDPGHGWAKVKLSELIKLGIHTRISGYSYRRGDYVYLEEDCDLSLYLATLKAAGIEFTFKEHVARTRSSKIRSYERYNVPAHIAAAVRDVRAFVKDHIILVTIQ
jgi:hypothetical protein